MYRYRYGDRQGIQFLEMGVVRDWLYLRVSMDRLIRGLPDR